MLACVRIGMHMVCVCVQIATEGVRLRPESPHAHNILGATLRETGDKAASDAAFYKALDIDPGFAEAGSRVLGLGWSMRERMQCHGIVMCWPGVWKAAEQAWLHGWAGW